MDFSAKMFREVPGLAAYHHKEGNLNWPMMTYVALVHVLAAVGIPTMAKCSPETLLWAFLCWPIRYVSEVAFPLLRSLFVGSHIDFPFSLNSGIGITVGVHRLWSHRSYEASFPARVFLMLCNSMANQGSIYHWSRDHRVHHKFSEVGIVVIAGKKTSSGWTVL